MSSAIYCSLLLVLTASSNARPACDGQPADVFFILDSSSSIWSVDFTTQLRFVKDFIRAFNIGPSKIRVGVSTFSDDVHPVIDFDHYNTKEELLAAVDGIKYLSGLTYTDVAIEDMLTRVFVPGAARREAARVAVVITDGISREQKKTAAQALLAQKDGIYMFAIGVGNNIHEDELKAIASDPDGDFVYTVDNYDSLKKIKDILVIQICDVSNNAPTRNSTTAAPQGIKTTTKSTTPIQRGHTVSAIVSTTNRTPVSSELTKDTAAPSTRVSTPARKSTTAEPPTTTILPTATRTKSGTATGRGSTLSTIVSPTTRGTPELTTATASLSPTVRATPHPDREMIKDQAPSLEKTGNQTGCSRPSVDVIFTFNSCEVGITGSRIILNLVEKIIQENLISVPKVRVGLLQDDCLEDHGDIVLSSSMDSVLNQLGSISYSNVASLLQRLRTERFYYQARDNQLAVLFVDGPLKNAQQAFQEAQSARRGSVEIFVVAIGNAFIESQVESLCSYPAAQHVIRVSSYAKLQTIGTEIANRICISIDETLPKGIVQ